MEIEFFATTFIHLLINLVYTILALILGIIALKIIDKRLLKTIDLEEEMKKGNIAVAIFASTILIFIAIIVAVSMK